MASSGGQSTPMSAEHILKLLGDPAATQVPVRHQLLLGENNSRWYPLVMDFVEDRYADANEDELEVLVAAFCHAFAQSTEASYVGRLKDFALFCAEHDPPLPCMPASKTHVHLYLAHLALRGTVAADGLPGVVSAINSAHRLLGFEAPVDNDKQHKLVIAGLQRVLVPLTEKRDKVPLRAGWLDTAIQHALQPSAGPLLVRDVTAVCVGFACGFRGSTVAGMLKQDLQVTPGGFRVSARVLKRRSSGVSAGATWEVFTAGHPKLQVLVSAFVQLRARFSDPGGKLWVWPGLPGVTSVTESVVDTWVQRVVALGDTSVQSHLYSSHSMRVGAASGMNALAVPRDVIRVWIRWQTPSMLDLYIRPVPADDALQGWFGWLLQRPPTMRG